MVWRVALLAAVLAALATTAESFTLSSALGLRPAAASACVGRDGQLSLARPARPPRVCARPVAMAQDQEEEELPSAILRKHAGRIVKISDPEGWVAIQKIAEMKSAILLAEFRAMSCRKCMALEGKYAKLPKKFEGKAVLFAEVDAQKVGKEVRTEAGVVKVPVFQIWLDGEKLEGYLAEDIGVTMGRVEAMVQRNLHLAKGHELFRGVEVIGDEPEETLQVDPLAGWRKHQSTLVRAPGLSSRKSSTTLQRTEGGGDEPEAPEPEAKKEVGASSEELLSELEAVKSVAKKANGHSAVTSNGDGRKLANGGGSTREELLAQLEAISAKKKQQ